MLNSRVRKRQINSDDIYIMVYEAMKAKSVFDLKLCNFVKFCYGNVCRIKRFDLDLSHPSLVALYKGIQINEANILFEGLSHNPASIHCSEIVD